MYVKMSCLLLFWLIVFVLLFIQPEKKDKRFIMNVPSKELKGIVHNISLICFNYCRLTELRFQNFEKPKFHQMSANFYGPFTKYPDINDKGRFTATLIVYPTNGPPVCILFKYMVFSIDLFIC